MDIVILESAHKHGFTDEDILHALEFAIVSFEWQGRYRVIVAKVGPAKNASLIEVFIDDSDGSEKVFHVMALSREIAREAERHLATGE